MVALLLPPHPPSARTHPPLFHHTPAPWQSEYGDLYRVSLDYEGETVRGARGRGGQQLWAPWSRLCGRPHVAVTTSSAPSSAGPNNPPPFPLVLPSPELRIKYYDTIPPCAALCLMRKGFLFAASEFGDHALYMLSVRRRRGPASTCDAGVAAMDAGSVCWPKAGAGKCGGCVDARAPACVFPRAQSLGEGDDTVESSSSQLMETEEGFQVGGRAAGWLRGQSAGADWAGHARVLEQRSRAAVARSPPPPRPIFLPWTPPCPTLLPRSRALAPHPQPVFFDPRPLTNLELLDRLDRWGGGWRAGAGQGRAGQGPAGRQGSVPRGTPRGTPGAAARLGRPAPHPSASAALPPTSPRPPATHPGAPSPAAWPPSPT